MLLHRSPALRDSKARADRRSGYPKTDRQRSGGCPAGSDPSSSGRPQFGRPLRASRPPNHTRDGRGTPGQSRSSSSGFPLPNYRARCNRCDRPSWPPHPEAAAYMRSNEHPMPSCLAFRTASHRFRAAIHGHPLLWWCAPYEPPSSRPPVHPSSACLLNPCWLSGSGQKRDRLPPQQAF